MDVGQLIPSNHHITTLLIDLDDTVYPASRGIWSHIEARMETYMVERLHIPAEQVPTLRRELWQKYGTTLRGLQSTHQIDTPDFLAYVHNVPLDQLLEPDPRLSQLLKQYPQRKYVFTNADRAHAERVLTQLQLSDCFDGIVDIVAISPYCKPMPESFEIAFRLIGINDPSQCLFVDDGLSNVSAARKMGIYSVLISEPRNGREIASQAANCDAVLSNLADLPSVLPFPSSEK